MFCGNVSGGKRKGYIMNDIQKIDNVFYGHILAVSLHDVYDKPVEDLKFESRFDLDGFASKYVIENHPTGQTSNGYIDLCIDELFCRLVNWQKTFLS